MQITSEPLCSDPCVRLKIQIPMHLISWGCPKIVHLCDPISQLINTFGIHLEPGCKSHEQIIHYRTAKNVQKQASFALFLDEFLSSHPEGISCSLTCTHTKHFFVHDKMAFSNIFCISDFSLVSHKGMSLSLIHI